MDAMVIRCNLTWGRCPNIKQTGGAMQFKRDVHGVEGLWIGVDNGMISVLAIRFLDVGERC